MIKAKIILRALLNAGGAFFRSPVVRRRVSVSDTSPAAPALVPIRSVEPDQCEQIATHLLALDAQDRYLRFGYAANDAQIARYVDGLNFERDEIFGIYDRKIRLIAVAHLAFSTNPELESCAEFGVSVLKQARGRGYGSRLFDRAVIHGRNEGVDMMFIHALSENTAMLNIVRKAGATIEREGAESEAYLVLSAADLGSRISELVDQQIAQTDYRLKTQAKQFWDFLATLQAARCGVREGRREQPPT